MEGFTTLQMLGTPHARGSNLEWKARFRGTKRVFKSVPDAKLIKDAMETPGVGGVIYKYIIFVSKRKNVIGIVQFISALPVESPRPVK